MSCDWNKAYHTYEETVIDIQLLFDKLKANIKVGESNNLGFIPSDLNSIKEVEKFLAKPRHIDKSFEKLSDEHKVRRIDTHVIAASRLFHMIQEIYDDYRVRLTLKNYFDNKTYHSIPKRVVNVAKSRPNTRQMYYQLLAETEYDKENEMDIVEEDDDTIYKNLRSRCVKFSVPK